MIAPPMPPPVREVLAGGAVSNAIDWIAETFWRVVWSDAAYGAFSAVCFAILFVSVGYLGGRARK